MTRRTRLEIDIRAGYTTVVHLISCTISFAVVNLIFRIFRKHRPGIWRRGEHQLGRRAIEAIHCIKEVVDFVASNLGVVGKYGTHVPC